jgi:predicted 3-demethylubiquinone-9 3-methyltransferase (glyoxalase superfamily)
MTTLRTPQITPFLWFDGHAEPAARFYASIFPDSEVTNVSPMIVNFRLSGQEFMGLNGGPHFKFTEAVSFFVSCETQEEVDYYWDKLSVGGSVQQCGWLKDQFGLSWQIVPTALGELMGGPDSEKSQRVFQAMMKMVKLDIAGLKAAAETL